MTPDPDFVAGELARMVAHLAHIRDRGCADGRSLREQRAWRAGVNEAINVVASSALLVTMGED